MIGDPESAWERGKKPHFLRKEKQLTHPVRGLIVENAKGRKVLDCGCASCIDYPLWIKQGIQYVGVDITRKFLDHAKKLYPDIIVYQCNVANMPFGDKSFPTVYAKDLLEHLPPGVYTSILSEMWRVTEKRMMMAFYIAPWNNLMKVNLIKNHYYEIRYNKKELLDFLYKLPGMKGIQVIKNIGDNNTSLFIVDRVTLS